MCYPVLTFILALGVPILRAQSPHPRFRPALSAPRKRLICYIARFRAPEPGLSPGCIASKIDIL